MSNKQAKHFRQLVRDSAQRVSDDIKVKDLRETVSSLRVALFRVMRQRDIITLVVVAEAVAIAILIWRIV